MLLGKVLCICLQDQTRVVFLTRFILYNSYYHYCLQAFVTFHSAVAIIMEIL